MAQSTINTFLKVKNADGDFVTLIDIKDYPDLGSEPEMVPSTTLSNRQSTAVTGVQELGALTFTANHDIRDYANVKRYEDGEEHDFQLWCGNLGKGEEGIFYWKGTLTAWKTGGGVNDIDEIQIAIANSTDIMLKQAVVLGVTVVEATGSLNAEIEAYNEPEDGIDTDGVTYSWKSGATESALVETDDTTAKITSPDTNEFYQITVHVPTTEDIVGGTFTSKPYKYLA